MPGVNERFYYKHLNKETNNEGRRAKQLTGADATTPSKDNNDTVPGRKLEVHRGGRGWRGPGRKGGRGEGKTHYFVLAFPPRVGKYVWPLVFSEAYFLAIVN